MPAKRTSKKTNKKTGYKKRGLRNRRSKKRSNKKPIKMRRRSKRNRLHGGALQQLIPSDLTNIYRSVTNSMSNTMNAVNGNEFEPNPLPYKDQLQTNVSVGEILRTT